MKPQPSFVGPDCAVELNAEAAVDLYFALIIHPRNAKHDDALRLCYALEYAMIAILQVAFQCRL
jgi:hypothetical protein